jgi:hypothetical protein
MLIEYMGVEMEFVAEEFAFGSYRIWGWKYKTWGTMNGAIARAMVQSCLGENV